MHLIPEPKKLILGEDYFTFSPNTSIVLDSSCSFDDLETALVLQSFIKNHLGYTLAITKALTNKDTHASAIYFKHTLTSEEGYTLAITPLHIIIGASHAKGLFYGVQTLQQIITQHTSVLPCLHIEDEPLFKHRGFYHDVTRGKVPTLETLMALVDEASHYKINQLQLYIEHTFAFEGMSEVWYDKSPLSAEDILRLDAYCKTKYVELIPSLSTFGHLYEALRTQSFKHLCELDASDHDAFTFMGRMRHHTLNPLDPNSIAFVESMLDQFIPLFSSEYFNICCDETFDLGKGKSKVLADTLGPGKLYTDFLNQIIAYVKSYGKQVMFWSDIILHHPELLSAIPEDVICLTWNYDTTVSEKDIRTIASTTHPQYLCSGTLCWNKLISPLEASYKNISSMVHYGKIYGALGILNTDWGDFGHINHLGSSLPGMIIGASLAWSHSITAFDTLCENISLLTYGDATKKIVGLLDALSKTQVVDWGNIIRWKETGDFVDVSLDTLLDAYEKACYLEHDFITHYTSLRSQSLVLNEYLNSIKGARLLLAVGSFILNQQDPSIIPLQEAWPLASALEVWYYEYQQLWMMRNKISEIHRIQEVITYLCKWLRSSF